MIAFIQGFGIALGLEGMNEGAFVLDPGWAFRFMTVITLVAGTAFLMWLGEQITERGIGNGISLIIFAGIVSGLPSAIGNTVRAVNAGEMNFLVVLGILAIMLITILIENCSSSLFLN